MLRLHTTLMVLLIGSVGFAQMQSNCTNDNTFLKLNETKLNEAGQRTGELYMNFKELNRILNLPEVIIRQYTNGLVIRERNSKMVVLLRFKTTQAMQPDEQSKREVTVSVSIEGTKIREAVTLSCDK